MNSFRIDFDLYTNTFHSTYPIFLQEKNVSQQEFSSLLNHFTERMTDFNSKRKRSQYMLTFLTLFCVLIGTALTTMSVVLVITTRIQYFWIMFGLSLFMLIIMSILIPVYYGRKIRNETVEAYQQISKEMDYESQKFFSRGVQFIFKVHHEYRYGHKTSYIHDTPYIEVLTVQQTEKQNQFSQYHFQHGMSNQNNQYYQTLDNVNIQNQFYQQPNGYY